MKLSFRPEKRAAIDARYPTHVEGRRVFLQQLGLAIGGGVAASLLPGCGSTSSGGIPDGRPAPLDGLQPEAPRALDGASTDISAPGDLWPDTMIDPVDLEPVHDLAAGDTSPDSTGERKD
jgi:hypothetical protein